MAVFRVSLLLEPVPQAIVNEIANGIYDELERWEFDEADGIRLTSGKHLAAGARYEVAENTTVTLRAWRRDGNIEFDVDDPDSRSRVHVRNDANGPIAVTFTGSGGRKDRRPTTWKGTADLARWWAGSRKRSPIVAEIAHRFALGQVTLDRAPADGRWKVDVRAKVRGRGLLRPLAGFALLCAHVPVARRFRETAGRFEEQWNVRAPEILARLREGPALEQLERLLAT